MVSPLDCRGQSWWSLLLRGQSFLLVSRSSWLSWSVFAVSRSSWMVFIFYGAYAHVFTETYGWGKTAVNVWTNVRGVGRTHVGDHETRPKPKPNVDYYLVTYLLLLLLLLNVY